MKVKGPLVTLGVGGVLAAALLIANVALSQAQGETRTQQVAAVAAPSAAASASTSPSASASPAASPAANPVALTQATYAGKVRGGGSLSVVLKGSGAIAYLCDGKNEAWLWGTTDGTAVMLKNRDGGTLTGTRGGGKLTGSITVGGTTWSFALPSGKKPSGVYRSTATVRGAKVVAGWVVLPDGSQVGAWTADGGTVTPAPPLDLAGDDAGGLSGGATVDGAPVTATAVDPTTTAF